MDSFEQPQAVKKSSTGKIVAFVGCGCLTLILLVGIGFGAIFFFAMGAVKKSAPFLDSIAAAEGNPAVVEAIGTPIEPGFMITSSISTVNGDESIDLSIPVTGPNGSGTIQVVGSKPSGATDWTYETWQLDVEGGDSIPLGQ